MAALLRFFDQAFGRYALTSALATGSDFALASTLHALGMPAAPATFLGCAVGGGVAFTFSRRWTFQASAQRRLPQLMRFLFVWASSALLNSSGVPALLPLVASFPLAWLLVRAAVYLAWNYPLARWFVFARARPSAGLSAP